MPSINDVCYSIAVIALLGVLFFVVLGDFNYFSDETPNWKLQLLGSALGAGITAAATLCAVFLKDRWENRLPLDFKVKLNKSNTDNKIQFVFNYKNNSESKIKIDFYQIQIMRDDKYIYSFPIHSSSDIVNPQEEWQEKPYGDVTPDYYRIYQDGNYNIVVTIYYRYRDETKSH